MGFRFQLRRVGPRPAPGAPHNPAIDHHRRLATQCSAGSRRGSAARDAALLVFLSRATRAGFVPLRMGLTVNRLDWIRQGRLVFAGQTRTMTLVAIQSGKKSSLEYIHVTLPHNKYGDSRTLRAGTVKHGLLQLMTAVRLDRATGPPRSRIHCTIQVIGPSLKKRSPGCVFYCPLP